MLTIETTQQKKTENGAKKDTKLILKGTPITFTLQSARILTESYIRERGAAESQIAECDADYYPAHVFPLPFFEYDSVNPSKALCFFFCSMFFSWLQ